MGGASSTGDVVFGRYRIEAPLGRGAAGFSYRGVDLETEAAVVVKELPASARDMFGRYEGEVAVLEELSESFVDPDGMGRIVGPVAAGPEHGQHYSVRPFVEGTSLRERLQAGRMEEQDIRAVFGSVARALGAAHRENLVLRNLKPENVLVDASGKAFVVGLGTGVFLTRARREELGVELGGLRYVAPEQLLDARRVDRRTDLFALGLMLFEALAGRPLVQAAGVPEAINYLAKSFEPPRPSGPNELVDLAMSLVHFHPSKRPPEADPVVLALAPWLAESIRATACEGCGDKVEPRSAYCSSCGRTMRGPCPHCGSPVAQDAAFCRSCGSRVEVAPDCRLVGLVGSFQGEVVQLPGEGELKIGRAKSCDISFENRDQYVSRHQAAVRQRRGRRWIEGGDWDSGRPTTNGTLLNGRNLDGQGPTLLLHGDRLRVGDSFFRYEET